MKAGNQEFGLFFAVYILWGTLAREESGTNALAASARLFAADASRQSGNVRPTLGRTFERAARCRALRQARCPPLRGGGARMRRKTGRE